MGTRLIRSRIVVRLLERDRTGCSPLASSYAMSLILALTWGLVLFPSWSLAATYNPPVDQDSFLKESSPDENHGSDEELIVKNKPTDSFQTIYRYDLSTIPANSVISSATATYYVKAEDDSGDPVNVYRVATSWTEGGVTWNTTGNEFDPSTVDASFTPTSTGAITVDIM